MAWRNRYELLKDSELISEAAAIVRCHHAIWCEDQTRILSCYILCLADEVDRQIWRDIPILCQINGTRERILKTKSTEFSSDCVEAFVEVSGASPAFWPDATSKRVYAIISREVDWRP